MKYQYDGIPWLQSQCKSRISLPRLRPNPSPVPWFIIISSPTSYLTEYVTGSRINYNIGYLRIFIKMPLAKKKYLSKVLAEEWSFKKEEEENTRYLTETCF